MPDIHSTKLAVIGLGYVGLPLAVEFSKKIPCVGFDLKEQRIAELNQGLDVTQEVPSEKLVHAEQLRFTSLLEEL
jgi:UDP-N-acetyl-D-galactosamine dehydrogenase